MTPTVLSSLGACDNWLGYIRLCILVHYQYINWYIRLCLGLLSGVSIINVNKLLICIDLACQYGHQIRDHTQVR